MIIVAVTQVRLQSHQFQYNYSVTGVFAEKEITLLQSTLDLFYNTVGVALGEVLISRDLCIKLERNRGNNFRDPYLVCLNTSGLTEWTVVHELGHALDASRGWQLSRMMKRELGSGFPIKPLHKVFPKWKLFWYHIGSPPPPCGVDKNFNQVEDFAETVTAYIFPDKAKQKAETRGYPYEKWGYDHFHHTPRGMFFQGLLAEREYKTPS